MNKNTNLYQLELIDSSSCSVEFIQSVIDFEASKRKKGMNLNLGYYATSQIKENKLGSLDKAVLFFELHQNEVPIQIELTKKRLMLKLLSPIRLSIQTANYSKTHDGLALIVPLGISDKTKIIRLYKGVKYGVRMGHGSVEIWKKMDDRWCFYSTYRTWIS